MVQNRGIKTATNIIGKSEKNRKDKLAKKVKNRDEKERVRKEKNINSIMKF